MQISRLGASSLALAVAGLAVGFTCTMLIHDQRNIYLVPYIALELAATVFGSMAAFRGSRWWLLVPLSSILLAIQAAFAVLVE